jgi:SOS-response transcriptional repressor LexA
VTLLDTICLPLTDRQETVLRLVIQFLGRQGYPPTIAEIQAGCELCNPGSVSRALSGLIQKEYLIREKGRHRGLRPMAAAELYFSRRDWDWPGPNSMENGK